jgi:uncharacterized protein (TIGR01319 family)
MTPQIRERADSRLDHAEATVSTLVDFGSTYTKVRVVDRADGRLLAASQHRTTVESDVLDGLELALSKLGEDASQLRPEEVHACSSAGGGLRLGVVGLEEELTGEAARRAALSAGARVVCAISGGLRAPEEVNRLLAADPDIVLLTGGTNGGNAASLIESATMLAGREIGVPIVLAGNELAQPEAVERLQCAGKSVYVTANVMPEIGVIDEHPVRELIRELFIEHVIGGKGLSCRHRFKEIVRMATPDAVLTGVEILAKGLVGRGEPGSVIAIDLGGATTDVHSVIPSEGRETRGYKRRHERPDSRGRSRASMECSRCHRGSLGGGTARPRGS